MITRKEFLKAVAGTAITGLLPGLPSASSASPRGVASEAAVAPSGQIKRGVTFYSYQDELVTHRMKIEDCVAAVSDLGTDGVELIGEEGVPGFPNLSDKFVQQWFGWMEKYRTKPVCYDCVYDANLYPGRLLDTKESVDIVVRDLNIAHRLGFHVVRAQRTIPPEVIEQVVPSAEKLDIKMGIEIHAPVMLKSAWIDPFMAVIEKTKTKNFGFVLDMGIFVRRPPRVLKEWSIRHGANPGLADYVDMATRTTRTWTLR